MKDEVIGANVLTRFSDTSTFRLLPSAFPVVPLGEPYWNAATYRAILRSLFSASVIEGTAIGDLRSLVIETLGVEDALLCSSGSCALEIALRACGVGKNDEVVIPTFCCSAVVPPILAVGALPVLADIGPELNLTVETVDAALTRKTRAIIVPHLFGNPADIGAIVALAGAKNIRVIDDAAQALGATIDGRAVGTLRRCRDHEFRQRENLLRFGRRRCSFGKQKFSSRRSCRAFVTTDSLTYATKSFLHAAVALLAALDFAAAESALPRRFVATRRTAARIPKGIDGKSQCGGCTNSHANVG